MTRRQLNNRRISCISDEKTIIDYHRRHPDKSPDGSFAFAVYMQGLREGRAEGWKQAKKGQSSGQ
jgi:hypothetical protein